MTFELLTAALEAKVDDLITKMNIDSDAIIVNQCSEDREDELTYRSHRIKVVSQTGRGVGLSRNTALSESKADIVLFSDEDIVYYEDYEAKVLKAFSDHPDAELITFNIKVDPRRKTYENTDVHRITWKNYGRHPAYAIAARRDSLNKYNIRYSILFGGGAKYSNGEDSLFLHDCLKAGMIMYSETALLGEETYRESTWFKGYTDKFFFDRGVLYHFLYGKASYLLGIRFIIKNRKEMLKNRSFFNALGLLFKGIKEGKTV